MTRLQFALIGDSLTQQSFDGGGWGARLASLYQRKADILVRGYSGYNTRWALLTLDRNFPTDGKRFDLATIWYGANDAALADRSNSRQHVPLGEYEENLSRFVDRMLKLGAKVVVFTPPPVDDEARRRLAVQYGEPKETAQPERTLEAAHTYAKAAQKVAKSRGVLCLDLWTKLQEHENWQKLLSDGLHFTSKGSKAVFDILLEFLNRELPQFRAEDLPPDFPWHTDLGEEDFAATFEQHASKEARDETCPA